MAVRTVSVMHPRSTAPMVVTHSDRHYFTNVPEIRELQSKVLSDLSKGCKFGIIFAYLEELGWTSAWVDYDRSYYIPPWGSDRKEAFSSTVKKKITNLSLLRENIDYFAQNDKGRSAVHAYLKKHGFRDRDTDIVPAIDSGITIEPIKLETVPAAPKAMAEAKVTETTSTKSNATAEDTKPRLKVKEIKAKARVKEIRHGRSGAHGVGARFVPLRGYTFKRFNNCFRF